MGNEPHADSSAPRRAAHVVSRDLISRIFIRSENFVAGRYWMLEVLFLAVLFSILFSGGVDDRLWEANNNYWYKAYFQKIEHPLLDVAKIYPPATHDAKLNFRLTVPVILHILHVPSDQRWVLPVLAAAGTCALILISCVFAFRVTRDRVCGLYVALAVCSTYIGSFAFTMYYDSIALAQLALAMLPRLHWTLRGLLVFTASFTDERAFLASPILLAQSLYSTRPGDSLRERLLKPQFLSVIAGMIAYCLGRFALEKYAGLTSPHKGVGFDRLLFNLPFWHGGVWLALKGGWLLVAVACICLWQRRQFLALGVITITCLASLSGAFLVEDVVRSTAYVFPGFLIALAVTADFENIYWTRVYCLAAFVISTVAGNYNIWRGEITWFPPLAVKFVYYLLHLFIKSPRLL
jgi:hypothetical protein